MGYRNRIGRLPDDRGKGRKMPDLNVTPDQETVKQYIDIIRQVDWLTAAKSVALLIIGLFMVRLIVRLLNKGIRKTKIPDSLHSMIKTGVRIILDLVVILSVLSMLGIPVTSFVTLIGLAGLALSLAIQGVLNNLAGGLIILGSKPFKVGDFVEADGVIGTVRDIRMMNTQLESIDGKGIYIPNSRLYTARIINYNQTGTRRVDISLSAAYTNSPEEVRKAAFSAAKSTPKVLQDPEPKLITEEYGESAIHYTLWVWCKAFDYLEVKHAVTERLYTAFQENGVEMTYPHLNVHMKE